jgi:uncharacterized protein YbcV (DUF1398 family)
MTTEQALVILEASRAAITGEMTFPQIVGRLKELGIERYHADYSRQEKTFYFASGASMVAPLPCEDYRMGVEFSAADVKAAVTQSQRGEHSYPEFLRKTMAAGCVGYFVQIAGRRALYFGRNGETHVEIFPAAGHPGN